jgi:AraC-like DNA-binding protein
LACKVALQSGRPMRGSNAKPFNAPRSTGIISRLAFALAQEKGADADALLNKCGLSREQIDDQALHLDVQSQIKFLELVAKAVDDDLLGFHLAQQCDLRRLGLGYYVPASSETLLEAFRHAARYSSVVNEGIRLTLQERSMLGIFFEYVNVARYSDRHQIEFWLAVIVRICRRISDRNMSADRVRFVHRRSPNRELSTYFGCDAQFGCDVDELIFPLSARDIAVVSGDPYLNQLLVEYCEEALGYRRAGQGSFAPAVENTIAVLLPHGKANAGEVARKLGLSERTLARRLCLEGLRFAGVRQRLRCDLAKRHLADKDLSVSKIAWFLGYQHVGAFTNAFKRWTGMAPRTFRRKCINLARDSKSDPIWGYPA